MKRLCDVLLVLVALPLWLPLAALVALAVLVCDGRPVLYVSDRAGMGGEPFRFLKFRTMRPPRGGRGADDSDGARTTHPPCGGRGERGADDSDGARTTRLGRFLRSTSLDELPQLLHVLSGRMALVGPRPLPVRYLPRYTAFAARRHEVRPGITGWAQVNGRNALSWEEKFALDVWYVDHRSLALDARIVLLTLWRVVRRTGVNHPEYDTMCEYKGGSET